MIISNDKKDAQIRLQEKTHVEDPFLDQLTDLGGDVLRLQHVQSPGESFRHSFDEVVLRPKLEDALRTINPFLDAAQLEEVVRQSTHLPHARLLENNQAVLRFLNSKRWSTGMITSISPPSTNWPVNTGATPG